MSRRIRTIGGGVAASGPGGSATVRIGPDYGRPPSTHEQRISGAQQSPTFKGPAAEQSIGSSFQLAATYPSLAEEQSLTVTQSPLYRRQVAETAFRPPVLFPVYRGPVSEQSIGAAHTQTPAFKVLASGTRALTGTVTGAPFWQSVATRALTAAGTLITIDAPIGTVQGDLMLAWLGAAASGVTNPTVSAPAGWTPILATNLNDAAVRYHGATFWKIATSSEPASYDFTVAVSASQGTGEIHRINGTDATTPINVSATAILAAAGLDPDPDAPSVTTTVTNCMVFAFLLHAHLTLPQTHTPGASNAERTDFESTVTGTSLGSSSQTRVFAAAAATGTVAFDCTETVATGAIMQRIAIAPGPLAIS